MAALIKGRSATARVTSVTQYAHGRARQAFRLPKNPRNPRIQILSFWRENLPEIDPLSVAECTLNLNRRLFSTEPAPSSHLARSLGPSFALIVRSPQGQLEIGATPSLPGQQFPARQDDEIVTRFCIELGPGLDEVFERLKGACDVDNLTTHFKNSGDPDYGLQLVKADIIVSVLNGNAVFDDLTGIGSVSRKASRFKRLPITSEPDFDSLYPIISAASHWFYHLRRRPTNSLLTRSREVTIEFMELSETSEYDAALMPMLGPSSGNLITQDAQFRNVVDIRADEETLYGQRIRNSSKYTLYPYLFYFDSSDFSISKQIYLRIKFGIHSCALCTIVTVISSHSRI